MTPLYPEIKPYARHELAVDAIHTLYIEECGNPDGLPIVFLHGGPGAGCGKDDRRFFDPELYRIVLFDQRGSGRSQPHAELENNNTELLIEDCEKIREFLSIERWALFGGSWGSTLALLYAQRYPKKVSAMILRGIFLCRERDLHWFYQDGAERIFPDYWQDYVSVIAETERSNMISAYYRKLTGDNELAKMAAAKAWSLWEGRCATLRPHPDVVAAFSDPHMALSLARIEAHYFVNQAFIDEAQILNNVDRIAEIPGIIIHGRYDCVCPLDNAFELHKRWPNSELQIIRDAGHSALEPSIADALVKATKSIAEELGRGGDQLS
ncbi:prolyl aminopeptidase [Agaribacterium haliotis]|uniref:prolyl aminopeptidase n=1 Tax=Agaribacterium haliotis TaxID=2013869 RepID=UPI000BB57DBA|nr:prolyl aminopeptidase [Agaribacterium haliotis]